MSHREKSTGKSIRRLIFMMFLLGYCGAALAQEAAATDEGEEAAKLDRIEVTGSRIKRTDLEGPANVIVIDRAQLDAKGYTTVFEALSDLTVNNGFKYEGPESTNGFSPDVQTINLRGFGVGTTLTLVNGRRLANYPAAYQSTATVFSYGSIPVAAIDRIEILTTGASAIYGSDAVAGVVNIILKKDFDGTTVNVLWGTPTETHSTRDDWRLQLVNGKTFDKGDYTFALEYQNRKSITGSDYSRYDNQQDDYPFGEGVYSRTLLTLDQFKSAFGIFPRYRDPQEITGQSGEAACAATSSGTYAFRPGAGYFCADPSTGVPEISFLNEKESVSAYFNGKLEIGDGSTELFTDMLYYKSNSKARNTGVWISEDFVDVNAPNTVGYPYFAYDWYLIQRRFTAEDIGMNTDIKFDDEAWSALFGARGAIGDTQDWEISVDYSEQTYKSQEPALKWRQTIDYFLGTWYGKSFFGDDWWSGGTIGEDMPAGFGIPSNLYGPLPAGASDAFGLTTYKNKSTDWLVAATLSGDIVEMPAGPLSYAAVVEYEESKIKYIPDDLLMQAPPSTDYWGDPIEGLTGSGWYRLTGYNGGGKRKRYSVGAELRIPVMTAVNLNLAARYDHYDSTSTSFGGDVTPSASIEIRPTTGLLLRGGYTESFRAPDLALVFVNSGAFSNVLDYVNCLDLYVFQNGTDEGFNTDNCDLTSAFFQRVGPQELGQPALGAEKGHSWWAGFSWDIMDNLNLTVDYTEMELNQRVLSQNPQNILNDEYRCLTGEQPQTISCDEVPEQVVRGTDPTTGVRFIKDFYITSVNQYKEKASYWDIALNYSLNTEVGLFGLTLQYDIVSDHTIQLTSDTDPFDVRNDPFSGGLDFRSSLIGTLSWTYRDFSTTLTGIYRGSTARYGCTGLQLIGGCFSQVDGTDYEATGNWWLGSYVTFNWTGTYNWTDAFMTRLRVINVFDEKPPRDDTISQYEGLPWYNPYSYPGAGIGRYAAIEAQYTF